MNISFPAIMRLHQDAHKVTARSCGATNSHGTSIFADHRLPLSMAALVAVIVSGWVIVVGTGLGGFGLTELRGRLDCGAPIYPVGIVVFFASVLGGASCESGGVILFPVMSLAFHASLETVRDNALLIQCVGGVVVALAVVFAKCRVSPALNVAIYGTIGAWCGIIVGLRWVVPKLVAESVILTFGCIWLAIALAVFLLSREFHNAETDGWNKDLGGLPSSAFLLLGFLGALVCSVSGFGVDVAVFLGMTLMFRVHPEVAASTAAIVAMAAIVGGIVYRTFVQGGLDRKAMDLFMISAPLAVIGAPIGFLWRWRLGSLHRSIGWSLLALSSVNLILTMVALHPWTSSCSLRCAAFAGLFLILGTCMALCGRQLWRGRSLDAEHAQSEITREGGDSENDVEVTGISDGDGCMDGWVEAAESEAEIEVPRNVEVDTCSYVTFLRWLETNGTEAEKGMVGSLRIR